MDNIALSIEIGNRIASCRKAMNLTQAGLEELSGVSQNHISNLERGKSLIGAESLIKLANALNVTTDYLLTGKKEDQLNPQLEALFHRTQQLDEEMQKWIGGFLNHVLNMKEKK